MGTIFGFFALSPCDFFSAVVIIEDGWDRDSFFRKVGISMPCSK